MSLSHYARSERGAAAAEFAMWLVPILVMMLNVYDLGTYVFIKMQVENAAQAAAQAAWSSCTTASITGTCSSKLSATVAAAAKSTVLGSTVTVSSAPAAEYYCPQASPAALVANGSVTTCSDGSTAGYYVKLTVQRTFTPVVTGLSIASLLPGTISKQVWARIT